MSGHRPEANLFVVLRSSGTQRGPGSAIQIVSLYRLPGIHLRRTPVNASAQVAFRFAMKLKYRVRPPIVQVEAAQWKLSKASWESNLQTDEQDHTYPIRLPDWTSVPTPTAAKPERATYEAGENPDEASLISPPMRSLRWPK
jgi:hypothetical protein